jgi:hypothetical protein
MMLLEEKFTEPHASKLTLGQVSRPVLITNQ